MDMLCLTCGKDLQEGYYYKGKKYCSRLCYWKTLKGKPSGWKGKSPSVETREKMSQRRKGIYMGVRSPRWNGGISWHYLTKITLKRDNYTCQVCGLKDEEIMEVDHIIPVAQNAELIFEKGNLRAICPNCHRRKTNCERRQSYEDLIKKETLQ